MWPLTNIIFAVYGASHWDTLGRKLKIFTKMYSFCYQWWKNPRSRSDWSCLGRTSYRSAATGADRHGNTTLKYKKVKTKCITTKYVTPCIPTENFHTKPIGAEMPKGAEKTLQSESANQKEGRWYQVLRIWWAYPAALVPPVTCKCPNR